MSKKCKITGAIFDLDGTLLDSMYIWDTIGEDYLKSKRIVPEKDLSAKIKTYSLHQAAEYFIEEYGISDSVEKITTDINSMIEEFYFYDVLPKEGVFNFLSMLSKNSVKMCIATATDRCLAEKALKRCDLLNFFEEIFTCTEVGSGKEKPDIFLQAHKFLKTEKESTFIFEDALHAAQTAKNAGFNVCGVFDKSESNFKDLEKTSDIYIKSFKEAGDFFD